VLLVLWDIDGTLVDSAGHGRYAFDDAFEAVTGRPFEARVEMAGRTDHQIAMDMLDGRDGQLPLLLEELAAALGRRQELIRAEGRAYPGTHRLLETLAGTDGVAQSLLTGNLEVNAAVKLGAVDYLAKPADADDVVAALLAHDTSKIEPPENPMSADRVRWEHIQRIYEMCNRNVSETARRLNMHRRTLQRILAKRAPR